MGSLDFSLAFDSANPVIPLHVSELLGMPSSTASMISKVWCHQERYLQLAGETDPTPCFVTSSLPQGDALSMLGLAATLLGPHLDIRSRFAGSKFATYVDDRTFACNSASECVALTNAWRTWSNFLNLRENEDKTQFFHRTALGRRELVEAGAPSDKVLTCPKILGVQLISAQGRGLTQDEDRRFRKTTVLARRCSYLPHTSFRRCYSMSMTAISVVKWGWLMKVPPKQAFGQLEAAIRRCAATHRVGDPSLAKILRGHLCSPDFACFSAVIAAIYRFCKKTHSPFGSWELKSGLAKSIRSFFTRYGCSVTCPWTWRSNSANAARISLMPSSSWFASNNKALQRSLREIGRSFLYAKWAASPRIDSQFAWHVPYSEHRCAAARGMAVQSPHHTAVLVGANVSPAKLAVMLQAHRLARSNRKVPAPVFVCPFCHQPGADLLYVTWSCPLRQEGEGRPPPVTPVCHLQKRLGWPRKQPPDKYDCQILEWMVHCRRKILQERWPT